MPCKEGGERAPAAERRAPPGDEFATVVTQSIPATDPNFQHREVLRIGEAAARDGCFVATLARSEWRSAKERRALIHLNPRFGGEVALTLTKRPVWVRPIKKSPRHWFSWFVWSPAPRAPGRDAFLRFAGEGGR
jgi:hypothetical protein